VNSIQDLRNLRALKNGFVVVTQGNHIEQENP